MNETSRERIEDELLVLSARAGDVDAYRRLVERWQTPLWRFALRLTGREDEAWDVLQEAWMGIANGLVQLRDPRAFRTFAFRIVARRATDWLRGRERSTEPLEDDVPTHEAQDERDELESLRAALRRLPADKQALLTLHYLEGFDLAAIAEILGLPEGTVKSRLHGARELLRERMKRTSP